MVLTPLADKPNLPPATAGVLALKRVLRATVATALVATVGVGVQLGATSVVQAATPAVAAGAFTSLAPTRILDTRSGLGASARPVAGLATLSVQITGRGGVPASGVSAVAVNLTVAAPRSTGYLTAYPSGTARPRSSSVNFNHSQTVPNFAIVPVGADGRINLFNGSGGTVSLIADVSGYYRGGAVATAGAFASVGPNRILDTRSGLGAPARKLGRLASLDVQITGRGGVPVSRVSAVAVNITVTGPASSGYLTAYPAGTVRSRSSTLNFNAGQSVPNFAIVPLGAGGRITLYNASGGALSVIADVSGYFIGGAPGVIGAFGSVAPTRVLDTRSGIGGPAKPVGRLGTLTRVSMNTLGVPSTNLAAVAINITVAKPESTGFLTAYPDGTPRPRSSNVNFNHGQTVPNFAIVPVSADGTISIYNGSGGSTAVVVDISGYFLGGAAGGKLQAWGYGGSGQLGNGATANSAVPVPVSGLNGVVAATAGSVASYAVTADGGLWAFGTNNNGELGDGTTTNHLTPERSTTMSEVIDVAAGNSTGYALRADGTVWAWGLNGFGQVGDATTTNRLSPVQVLGLSGVVAIAAGNYNGYALKSDGSVWAWGINGSHELGDGSAAPYRSSPTSVSGLVAVTAIAAGSQSGYALVNDGTVRSWGANGSGQLGDGTTVIRATPVQVSGLSGVTQLAAGAADGYALGADSSVRAWGNNGVGQIGDGTTVGRLTPVLLANSTGSGVVGVAAISGTAYALGAAGAAGMGSGGPVAGWGYNAAGQVGDGSILNRLSPSLVETRVQRLGTGASGQTAYAILQSGIG